MMQGVRLEVVSVQCMVLNTHTHTHTHTQAQMLITEISVNMYVCVYFLALSIKRENTPRSKETCQ